MNKSVKSDSQSSTIHGGGISQSTIISNYISNDDLEYDDLGQEAENIKTGLGQSQISFGYGGRANKYFNAGADNNKGKPATRLITFKLGELLES